MIKHLFEVFVIVVKYFFQIFLFTTIYFISKGGKFLKNESLTEVYLLFFDVVIYFRALVHDVAAHHQLCIGQDLGDGALVPVVFVQVDAQAA